MDNIDDSENNAKVSDSGYSNSCRNSQTRSHSSKSTHSGSHSSGSSGYGGGHGAKPLTCSNVTSETQENQNRTKENETKNKFNFQNQILKVEEESTITNRQENVPEDKLEQVEDMVINAPSIPSDTHVEVESMDISTCGSIQNYGELPILINTPPSCKSIHSNKAPSICSEGFTCVISMHDGVVMYTTPTITASLDYPRDMWIGRSFIDFLHSNDRGTFASQIANSLAVPRTEHGAKNKDDTPQNFKSKMFCRVRRYRSINSSFGVKEKDVMYIPFLLMLSFKNIADEKGKAIYLVIQAIPIYSAFKVPNEVLPDPVAFVIRHSASGKIEYIDPESVPYLGYLPQDLADKDALNLYHPDDMDYIQHVYEELVKKNTVKNPRPYRMRCCNGEYLKLSSEWSVVINPWSRKLEYVIGKHTVVEGPPNPFVFHVVENEFTLEKCDSENPKTSILRDNILRVMNEVLTKPAELARQKVNKRCQVLMSLMENDDEETPAKHKCDDEIRSTFTQETDYTKGRESVIRKVISPQSVSRASTETRLSYTQLNYYETLQRYFDSYQSFVQNAAEEKQAKANNTAIEHEHSKMSSVSTNSSATKANSPVFTDVAKVSDKQLTSLLLERHNVKMEKELARKIREHRSAAKTDRQKVFNEHKQKKKEHIARCNKAYVPTMAETSRDQQELRRYLKFCQDHVLENVDFHETTGHTNLAKQPETNSLKRQTAGTDDDTANTSKHEGITHKKKRQKCYSTTVHASRMPPPPPAIHSDRFNPGYQHAMVPFISPSVSVQYLTYLQAVFGSAIVNSPIASQTHFTIPQNIVMEQSCTMSQNAIGLTHSNYIEACTHHTPPVTILRRSNKQRFSHKQDTNSGESSSDLSIKQHKTLYSSNDGSYKNSLKIPDSRNDCESSYSSFYSSFFKTESGSDSDGKSKQHLKSYDIERREIREGDTKGYESAEIGERYLVRTKKKPEPPWMENINLTPDLIFKYQIITKSLDEVLKEDKKRLEKMEQPSLVSDQMRQLFMDLQLEGAPANLTLEEGTSSSSSGEESTDNTKYLRRKREYENTAIVYEENAPFPPSPPPEEMTDEPMKTRD